VEVSRRRHQRYARPIPVGKDPREESREVFVDRAVRLADYMFYYDLHLECSCGWSVELGKNSSPTLALALENAHYLDVRT
jgi:hypothetical protein